MEQNSKANKCQWGKCELPSDLVYLGAGVCEKHWDKICEMTKQEACKKLGIKNETNVAETKEDISGSSENETPDSDGSLPKQM